MRILSLSVWPAATLLIFIGSCRLLAQTNIPADLSDSFFTEEVLDSDELQELIDSYRDNPLNWKTCRITDLRSLPLNDHIKSSLIELKRQSEKISDWQSLANTAGLNSAEIEAVRYFIVIKTARRQVGSIVNYISLKQQNGAADLQKSLQRIRFQSRNGWFLGAVLENDRDEPRLGDYCNFSLRSPKMLERWELLGGAYRLQWGQGLLFAANLMNGRSTAVDANLTPARSGFKNYLGADENRFLFGGAANLKIGNLSLSAFCSRHQLDASLDESEAVTNLRLDGLHISQSQIQAKDALRENIAGVSLLRNGRAGSLGLLLFQAKYSHGLSALNRQSQNSGVSFSHHHEFDRWTVSGEISALANGSQALTENFGINLHKMLLSFGWRRFSPEYYAPLGSPFRHYSGAPVNENGLYAGLKVYLPNRWIFSGYADFFGEIVSDQTGTDSQKGRELLAGFQRTLKSAGIIEIWYKTVCYYHAAIENIPVNRQIKFHLRQKFNRFFTGELRALIRWNDSVSFLNGGQALGLAGRIALPKNMRLTIGATHFFTSQSAFSIYFYEPGLSSQFNLRNLTGTGQRYYFLMSRRIGTACELSYAISWHSNRAIGTDNPATEMSGDLQLAFDLF